MLSTQCDLTGTLTAYIEVSGFQRKLATADPTNAGRKIDLGVSLAKLGQVAEAIGDKDGACGSFTPAIDQFLLFADRAPSYGHLKGMARQAESAFNFVSLPPGSGAREVVITHALAALALALQTPSPASAAASDPPPCVPAIDAPELAALGPYAVGVESLTLVQLAQPDVLAMVAAGSALPLKDRAVPVDVWYPAEPGGTPTVYSGALTGEDGKDVPFALPALAVRGAAPAAGSFPLVILAHGYGGAPEAMSWVAENLASKGYVVVGPHFRDPPYGEAAGLAQPLARRPLDIAFVAAAAQGRARAKTGVFAAADPARTVLIGYSMGGYGVLTAAGGTLGPALGPITHGALAPFVSGAPRAAELKVKDIAAVIAISPAGLFGGAEVWGPSGLAGITAPTLFLVGGQDHVVGYDPGVKTFWTQEIHAPRYLLTFENGGHSIGMDPAPDSMRGRLWDLDWWEDPVWRKERVIGIQLHMITAFLDRYVAGDAVHGADLDVATPLSNDGAWVAKAGVPYDAVSPGPPASTIWKGFQRSHAQGLELRFAPPQ